MQVLYTYQPKCEMFLESHVFRIVHSESFRQIEALSNDSGAKAMLSQRTEENGNAGAIGEVRNNEKVEVGTCMLRCSCLFSFSMKLHQTREK